VPDGFVQTMPLNGTALPLRAAGWYAVIVQGVRGGGMSTFTAGAVAGNRP